MTPPPGFFENIEIPIWCPIEDKKGKTKPGKKLKKAASLYKKLTRKHIIRLNIIKYKVDHIYIYRLRPSSSGNLAIYEIGKINDPWKYAAYYEFEWTDVSNRCCEGFWGDRSLVEKFTNAMNLLLIKDKKDSIK
jgi:hypothetical protein